MKSIYENSDDNLFRFALGEVGENPLIFICINPSTATPEKPDPTMRMIKAISGINGYDSCIMLNVCPQRATNPNNLAGTCNPTIHKKNIEVIKSIVKDGSTVVAAWGNSIEKKDYLINCLNDIVKELNGIKIHWKHLGDLTGMGNPTHPLSLQYLKSNEKLKKMKDLREFKC